MAKKVRKNISSARKIFKFLKFIDEYRGLMNLIYQEKEKKEGKEEKEDKEEKDNKNELNLNSK